MIRRRFLAAAAASLLLAACGKDATAPAPRLDVSGSWRGSLTSGTSSAAVTLTLTHTGDAVNGTGTMVAGTTSVPLSATGTVTQAGSVTLTMTSSGFQPISFTGTATASQISGAVSGSGFSGTPITLSRQ